MSIIWTVVGLTILAIAMPWMLKVWKPHEVTVQEVLASTGISFVITALCFVAFAAMIPRSTEILNGHITDKKQVRVSCSHSYQCNCYQSCSGSGSSRSCTRVCQTCYRHSHDFDWRVYNTVNNYINIARIDSQGKRTPPRWNEVIPGEAFSIENSYKDYLKITDKSLFAKKVFNENQEYENTIPPYPSVFDYYRVKLVRSTHNVNINLSEWNEQLRKNLKTWGNAHQINIVVVFTEYQRDFAEYLKNKWKGGRKNDAIIVLNVDTENDALRWGDIFSWSKDEFFNSSIRAQLNSMEHFDMASFMTIIKENIKHFERRPMEEFKYLLKERQYSWWQILIILVLQVAGNIAVWYTITHNNVRHSTIKYRRY